MFTYIFTYFSFDEYFIFIFHVLSFYVYLFSNFKYTLSVYYNMIVICRNYLS